MYSHSKTSHTHQQQQQQSRQLHFGHNRTGMHTSTSAFYRQHIIRKLHLPPGRAFPKYIESNVVRDINIGTHSSSSSRSTATAAVINYTDHFAAHKRRAWRPELMMHPQRDSASLPNTQSTYHYWHDAGRMRETIARRKTTRIRHQNKTHRIDDGDDDGGCCCSGGPVTLLVGMMMTMMVRKATAVTVAPEMVSPHVKVSSPGCRRRRDPVLRLRLLALYTMCYLIMNRSGVDAGTVAEAATATATTAVAATTTTTTTTATPAKDALKHGYQMADQRPITVNGTVIAGTDRRVDAVPTDVIGQVRMASTDEGGPSNQQLQGRTAALSANQVSAPVAVAVHLNSVQPAATQHHQQQQQKQQQQQPPPGGVAGDAEDYYFDDDDDANNEYINLISNKSGEWGCVCVCVFVRCFLRQSSVLLFMQSWERRRMVLECV